MRAPSSPTWPAARDALLVALVVLGFAALALKLELSEKLSAWHHSFEALQADEISLSLVVLMMGLAWLALRRLQEARRALLEQEKAEQLVADLLARNRELTQRLLRAQEDERRMLSRELHDEIGQACTALRAEAAWITHASPSDWPAVMATAQRIGQTSAHMHGLARDMLTRLRPPHIDSLGVVGALQALCHTWEAQCGVVCDLHTSLSKQQEATLSDAICVGIYRVVQEGLNNIARHAQATQVHVDLQASAQGLHLRVADNGVGMAVNRDHISEPKGLGLLGMRERAVALGGTIAWINTQPGTCIEVRLALGAMA
jgi:two-component system sensor histidine kinase UhpB